MAGNIVKWWKHKILGGYKQFSVQECTTDSEELMYHHQVRASSSCSAPPDLLLVNDRENNLPHRTDVNDAIGGATTPLSLGLNVGPDLPSSNNNQKLQHHQQHQRHQQHHLPKQQLSQQTHVTSIVSSTKDANGKHQKVIGCKPVQHNLQQQSFENNEVNAETQQHNNSSARHGHHQQRTDDHIRLEEFTCDVSVEGGKSSQPLQFSFTFYDLDGHHGKITKDDIVGIVYTIYESIGKSVVVPHSGSKTINVRLTVSPEGKSKPSKVKKQQNVPSQKDGLPNSAARRLHRYRPRKLIKSDDEDDDSNSEKEREGTIPTSNMNAHISNKPSRNTRVTKAKVDQLCCQQAQHCVDATIPESVYENTKYIKPTESCRECQTAAEETRNVGISPTHNITTSAPTNFVNKTPNNEAYMKHIASTRIKMLRKSRKQKYQDATVETRQRSLSVGSEACWNNRHLQKPTQQQASWNADQYLNGSDMLDGVQMRMRNPLPSESLPMAQKRNSAECWKSALNRNDLISIIRESMEKNRLCFQLNGKPQANVSPIRQTSDSQNVLQHKHAQRQAMQQQRQRSNTVSKIPMLIANHSYRSHSFSNNNDLSPNELHNNGSNSNNIYQLQPHLPSMLLTSPNGIQTTGPTTRSSTGHHSKVNLCGYDSFLHATICGGGLSHSPPPHTTIQNKLATTVNSNNGLHQQIATVQPILASLSTNTPRINKNTGLSMTPNQIRTSKILRSGSYSQPHQAAITSTKNSPQHQGYQRLCSNNRQNLSALNLERSQYALLERGHKEQVKNYDQLLYAKLTEKLQQTNLTASNKDNMQRRRHRVVRHRRSSSTVAESNKVGMPVVGTCSKSSDYTSLLPMGGDPVECENLIVPTSDDDCHSQHDIDVNDIQRETATLTRHVAEGTLVDLDDNNRNEATSAASQSITNEIFNLGIDFHLDDELVLEEDLDEVLADREEIGMGKSGRSSPASKAENEDTVANASITSSLIHRYVHEHIHHHYHHFEDNDE